MDPSLDEDESDEADDEETMRDEIAIDLELLRKELTRDVERELQNTSHTTSKRPPTLIQNDYSTKERKSSRLQRKDGPK